GRPVQYGCTANADLPSCVSLSRTTQSCEPDGHVGIEPMVTTLYVDELPTASGRIGPVGGAASASPVVGASEPPSTLPGGGGGGGVPGGVPGGAPGAPGTEPDDEGCVPGASAVGCSSRA